MSTDLEASLRDALRAEVSRVSGTPNAADVSRRVRRRRRQHRAMAAVPAVLVVLAAIAALMSRSNGDVSVASDTSPHPCVPSLTIPFRPGVLVDGWLMPSDNTWRLLPTAYVMGWLVPDGMIEVWNGARDDLPAPTATDRTITVLGQEVPIGPISDGFSVAFDLGPTRCDRWAIVAHPGVTEEQLATIARGLQFTP